MEIFLFFEIILMQLQVLKNRIFYDSNIPNTIKFNIYWIAFCKIYIFFHEMVIFFWFCHLVRYLA